MEPDDDDAWSIALSERYARLEALTTELLDTKFDPWQWQLDLLALQQDAQQAVKAYKSSTKINGFDRTLWRLQHCIFHARILGDAFAWLMFGLDRPALGALGENSRPPVPPKDDPSSRATIVAAGAMSSKGFGFPVFHDITNCLRIGDVTFVKPGPDLHHELTTVELKSHLVSKTPIDSETAKYEYEILAISTDGIPAEAAEVMRASAAAMAPRPKRKRRLDSRANRQIGRMRRASALAKAVDKGLVTLPEGDLHLSMRVSTEGHFSLFEAAFMEARQSGYACVAVDDATLVLVLYDPVEITPERLSSYPIDEQMQSLGFTDGSQDADEHETVLIRMYPGDDEHYVTTTFPFILSGFGRGDIIDLLYGRMIVTTFLFRSRLKRMLEAEGLELVTNTGELDFGGDSFVIRKRFEEGPLPHRVAEFHAGNELLLTLAELGSATTFIAKVTPLLDQAYRELTSLPPHAERSEVKPNEGAG